MDFDVFGTLAPHFHRCYLTDIDVAAEAYLAGFHNPHHYKLNRAGVQVPQCLLDEIFPGERPLIIATKSQFPASTDQSACNRHPYKCSCCVKNYNVRVEFDELFFLYCRYGTGMQGSNEMWRCCRVSWEHPKLTTQVWDLPLLS